MKRKVKVFSFCFPGQSGMYILRDCLLDLWVDIKQRVMGKEVWWQHLCDPLELG